MNRGTEKTERTHQRHMEILAAKGFIPKGLINSLVGLSREQWCRDLKVYRKAGNPPPLRVNKVTGREGYFHDEFMTWQKNLTGAA